ncbi:uncharacterized protein RCC_06098 [Ramularia collo-cygni]|uniref:Thioesterase domain-containing protein n=1 Tax=Ramularia collo-cygni TaxID=112498 RepID=A0A2D3V462_9PEZI|nr:uncharacterized protein RCC_06098 [Ramularia collo-cygni]CZT20240.1 uncharacterized protein RCC_06098 [Ramularia collo-cygni]
MSKAVRGSFPISIKDPVERIQAYMNTYQDDPEYDGFDALLMRNLRVISAKATDAAQDGMEAVSVYELDVVPGLCNSMGNMHGGAVATLADNTTTLAAAPISRPGFWEHGGVSRTLNVTYLRPITKGSTLRIECAVRSVGQKLAATQCSIRSKETGKVLALAEHNKAAIATQNLPGRL